MGYVLILTKTLCSISCSLLEFLPCRSNGFTGINCADHGLDTVPSFSSLQGQNITSLNLMYNRLQLLHMSAFASFPNLVQLNLKWNCPPQAMRSDFYVDCGLTIEPRAFMSLQHLVYLDLSANSLQDIPSLPSSLQYLSLNRNHILTLDASALSHLENLRELYIDGNCYYKNPCASSLMISSGALSHLSKLNRLSLKYNNMSDVPRSLPHSLNNLYLSYNQITWISRDSFRDLVNLRVLDIGGNCRRCDHASNPCMDCNGSLQLDLDSFLTLRDLESLMLRDNSLYHLDPQLFQPLSNLRILDLSENFLYNMIRTGTVFEQLKKLEKLFLSFNYHKRLIFDRLILAPSFRHLESLKELRINGLFFRAVDEESIQPLAQLRNFTRLFLQLNFISQINLSVFGNLPSLLHIDLSDNGIISPYHRKTLPAASTREYTPRLTGQQPWSPETSFISSLASEKSPSMKRQFLQAPYFSPSCSFYQKTLQLTRNNLVTIMPEMFKNLTDIDCLQLSFNSISQTVNGHQFIGLNKLKMLDLSHNKINLYFNSSFSELPQLEALDLSYNSYHFQMKGIGHQLTFISKMKALAFLNMAYNKIANRISTEIHSDSLQILLFAGNRLNTMWQHGDLYLKFFFHLTNLTKLDISSNYLRVLHPKTLANLPKTLKILIVKQNLLTSFNWTCLTLLPKLEVLDLSVNKLTFLYNTSNLFAASLQSLDLSYNRIDRIGQHFFVNTPALIILNLSYNSLQEVNKDWFEESLQHLDLRGNPLFCTCDSTFFEFILSINIQIPDLTNKVTCGSPYHLKNKSVFSRDLHFCSDDQISLCLFSISMLFIFLLMMGSTLKHFLGWDVWYTFYICLSSLCVLYSKPSDSEEYDAFIAFDKTQKDVADWVYNDLRIRLEEKGLHHFRVCLEDRDWIPGKSLVENLWDSVYRSKKTVFVLSRVKPVSGLLRVAFLLVQQRLLEEQKDVVVLILLEQLQRRSRYLRLRRRLCKKTVLFWPQDPCGQQYFWGQLCRVLEKDNHTFYDQNFSLGVQDY
ncbi:toll-like receptor 9 [Microcaecilia unicolor]|uniref:Toll-like receptor 9 n=1 Tax=Microcaecilia unicolor TaxID=1415580 RepID=A0A6P7YCH7_9AMPH|nr:toll-like receptor 9 [Microcaecilia unicolor]